MAWKYLAITREEEVWRKLNSAHKHQLSPANSCGSVWKMQACAFKQKRRTVIKPSANDSEQNAGSLICVITCGTCLLWQTVPRTWLHCTEKINVLREYFKIWGQGKKKKIKKIHAFSGPCSIVNPVTLLFSDHVTPKAGPNVHHPH